MSNNRKNKVNDDYFKNINAKSAYYLGFIAADGHITNYDRKTNHLIINILASDRNILDNLKKDLQYEGNIYNVNKSNGQTQVSIRICSNIIKEDINKYINTNNKTYELNWCKDIPDDLIRHFIRGYFDGDGCVHFNKEKGHYSASLVGTENFMYNLQLFYNLNNNNEDGSIKRHANYTNLTFGGKYVSKKFLDWIYKDSSEDTRLLRKYMKYLELSEYIGDEDKPYNNQKINFEIASKIRNMNKVMSATLISQELNIPLTTIYDVLSNRTWFDIEYKYNKIKQDKIYLTYEDKTFSLSEWSNELNIPKATLDRRYRKGLPVKQILSIDKRLKLGKKKSKTDLDKYVVARSVRQDYKNGIIGKSNYEKHNINKSQYIDIILNRTFKEVDVWWK